MTPQEKQDLIRVYGPNYEEADIPAYVRNRSQLEQSLEESRELRERMGR